MMQKIYVMMALAGLALTIQAQTTAYRLIATNTERWDGVIWLESDSSSILYVNADIDTLRFSYEWDDINLQWDKTFKNIYEHDGNGNKLSSVSQRWDGTFYTNYQKNERIFNAQNLTTQYTLYFWDGANWRGNNRTTYDYNADGKTTASTRLTFSAGSWVNVDRLLYTYSNGYLEVYDEQKWLSGVWQKDGRTVYTRDANGNATSSLRQNWTGLVYENNNMYISTFDANNNNLVSTYLDWVSGAWDSLNRTVYSYNANNQEISRTYQNWNGSAWLNASREVSLYNSQNLIDSIVTQTWSMGAWSSTAIRDLDYDAYGNNIQVTVNNKVSGVWVYQLRSFNYYEPYTITGIEESGAQLIVSVYPNPFISTLNFNLPIESNGLVAISIFDLSGRLMLQTEQVVLPGQQTATMDVSPLTQGAYIYTLSIGGKQASGRVIK